MNALLLLLLAASAQAVSVNPPYMGATISTTTGKVNSHVSGVFKMAGSSLTADTLTIVLDGASGGIDASSITLRYGVKASTANITGDITAGADILMSSNRQILGAGNLTVSAGAGGILNLTTSVNGIITVQTSNSANDIASFATDLRLAGQFNGTAGRGVMLNAYNGALWNTGVMYKNTGVGGTSFPNLYLQPNGGNVLIGQSTGTAQLDVRYGIHAASIAVDGGITASSGTFTQTGANFALQVSSGINVGQGVYAGFFSGNGSGLTNLPGSGQSVSKAGDTMTGQLTIAGATLTVTGNAFSVGGSTLVVSGGLVGIGTTAPQTLLDVNGDLTVRGQETVVTSVTIIGTAFSVGGSTFVISSGRVGIGTTSPTSRLTINQGNVTNVPAIAITNAGGGTSGIDIAVAAGGSLNIGHNTGGPFAINAVNRPLTYSVTNNGFNTRPIAHLFTQATPADRVVMAVQGMAGQTGDLQQWQNGAGVVLASVTAYGNIHALYGLVAATATITGTGGLSVTYGITAGSATLSGGITASSGTFTQTGAGNYSIRTSSGILVGGGGEIRASSVRWDDGSISTSANSGTAGGGGGGDATRVSKAGDSMTGQLTIAGSSLTIVSSPTDTYSLIVTSSNNRSSYQLTVTTTGHVSAPNQYYLRYYSTGTVQSVANATQVDVAYGTKEFDNTGGAYNINTSLFTVPADGLGVWDIKCSISIDPNATGIRQAMVIRNGAIADSDVGGVESAASNRVRTVYGSYYLNPGNTLNCQIYQDSGLTLNLNAGPNNISNNVVIKKGF